MKSKLKSGLENKYFARRLGFKRLWNGIYDENYFSRVAYVDYVLPYTLDYVHVYIRTKETQTSGWTQHNSKGKKDTIFLLVHSEMTVWGKKINNQSLWETWFSGTFNNSIATSVGHIFINPRVISVL